MSYQTITEDNSALIQKIKLPDGSSISWANPLFIKEDGTIGIQGYLQTLDAVSTNQIENEAITNDKISNKTITQNKISNFQIYGSHQDGRDYNENDNDLPNLDFHIKQGTIGGNDIGNSTITSTNIAIQGVSNSNLAQWTNTPDGEVYSTAAVTGNTIQAHTIDFRNIKNNSIDNQGKDYNDNNHKPGVTSYNIGINKIGNEHLFFGDAEHQTFTEKDLNNKTHTYNRIMVPIENVNIEYGNIDPTYIDWGNAMTVWQKGNTNDHLLCLNYIFSKPQPDSDWQDSPSGSWAAGLPIDVNQD